MAKVFTYTKSPVSIDRLKSEITTSLITIALDYINLFGDNLDIYFKTDLPPSDKSILDLIILDHTGEPFATEDNKAICITEQQNDYLPTPRSYRIGTNPAKTDGAGNFVTRGQAFTDEGSFRDNFFGDSLFQTLSGTFQFNNQSDVVLSNNADLSEMKTLFPYLKLSTDTDDKFTQGNLITKSSFGLFSNYKGTTGEGTAISSNWLPVSTENIGFYVSNSWLVIDSTTSNTSAMIEKYMDYLPLKVSFKANLSKRITGQTISFGVYEQDGCKVTVQFDGLDETKVSFITASKNSEIETETSVVSIPRGQKSSKNHVYTIEVTNGQCSLSIDDVVLAIHKDRIPDAYDPLYIFMKVNNATIASTNTFKLDWVHFQSLDQVDISNTFSSTPVKTDTVTPKRADGVPFSSTTPRPVGTYTYFSSQGDNSADQSSIAGGTKLKFRHAIGESLTGTQYFDINSIINETHINTATVQWNKADQDFIEGDIVPQVTEVTDQTGGNFTVISGIVIATPPGYGNKNVNLSTAKLVEMVPNEFGVTPSGFWDATYNTTTKVFDNITFNATGYGQFNIFATEIVLFRFIPCFCMEANGLYEVPSKDTSRLGHNMRIKTIWSTTTEIDDHAWSSSVSLVLYRKKTC